MVRFSSDLSYEELIEKWDEFTSPARFAGSDDTMDLIFVSKRKGDNVRLTRRARLAFDPFASIFRGKIKKTEQGSEVAGYFTKSVSDYIIVGLILALLFYIRTIIDGRGSDLNTINGLLVVAIVGGVLLLMNQRSAKRRYADFIIRITGKELPMFLTKKEEQEREEGDNKG